MHFRNIATIFLTSSYTIIHCIISVIIFVLFLLLPVLSGKIGFPCQNCYVLFIRLLELQVLPKFCFQISYSQKIFLLLQEFRILRLVGFYIMYFRAILRKFSLWIQVSFPLPKCSEFDLKRNLQLCEEVSSCNHAKYVVIWQ